MRSVSPERRDPPGARRKRDRACVGPDEDPVAQIATLGALASPAIEVLESTPIAELRELLVDRRVAALAVIDPDRVLCGIVTRTDVLRVVHSTTATAGEAMSRFVFVLPARSAIERAAALMAYEQVGVVVVTDDDGRVLGLVSAVDITRHYAILMGYLAD